MIIVVVLVLVTIRQPNHDVASFGREEGGEGGEGNLIYSIPLTYNFEITSDMQDICMM